MNDVDSGCAPEADGVIVLRNTQLGLVASAAEYRSSASAVPKAHTVAVIFALLPAVSGLPSAEAISKRSFDSSLWNVPEVPSAQELLIVFGWFGSAPPERLARPSNSDGPESQDVPTVAHFGAFKVLS